MTDGQKKAIKRICKEFDFDNYKELKGYYKERFDETLDLDVWAKDEETFYADMVKMLMMGYE